METYFVFWTYVANYGTHEVKAIGPIAAAQQVLDMYSEDFVKKAKIYVFKENPTFVSTPTDRQ